MTLCDGDICSASLCFRDERRERAFVCERHRELKKRVFIGVLTVLGYLMAVLGMTWMDMAPLEDSDPYRYGVALWALLVCMVWLFVSWPRIGTWMDPMCFEVATAAVLVHFAILGVLMEPWFLVKMAGSDVEKGYSKDVTDTAKIPGDTSRKLITYETYETHKIDNNIYFWLNLWLSCCHFMLPLRWKVLLPLEVTCVGCYVIPAVLLNAPAEFSVVVVNTVMFATLTCMHAVGKRDLEAYERTAFLQTAQERTIKAQAECRLAQAAVPNAAARPGSEAGSVQETNVTGQIFDVSNRASSKVTDQLEQMVQLGLQEHWLVQAADLQLESDCVLGQGGFGLVVRALYHGAEVAVKMSTITGESVPPSKLLATAQELRIFRRLRHPNIVQCYGAYINPGNRDIALVLEYVRGVSLRMAVVGPCRSLPACSFRCQLINDICCGINYLHGLKPAIIHGDIKDSNVMVERTGALARGKLLDFGLSRLLTASARNLGGTVRWMAPEVITRQEGAVALTADIFSLGRLIYYVIAGVRPLVNVDTGFVCAQAYSGKCPELEWPEDFWLEEETRNIVVACTAFEASERPDIFGVQAMLRTWPASLSPQLASTVASAFPQLSKPQSEFEEGLSRARASTKAGGTKAKSKPHGAGQHVSEANRVLHVGLESTPQQAMLLSLIKTITHWNVPTHFDDCCELHNTATVAQRVLDEIHSSSCAAIETPQPAQCSRCLMLASGEWARAKPCYFCGNDSAQTARDALGSIPEVPEIPATDDPGEDAPLHPVREHRAAANEAQIFALDEDDDVGRRPRINL